MKLTPLHLSIFLHYINGANEDFTPRTSTAIGYMNELVSNNLLQMDNRTVSGTPKGMAFLSMLINTPIPELRFMDPRTGSVVPIDPP